LRIGGVPRILYEQFSDEVIFINKSNVDFMQLKKSVSNALKVYNKTKKSASNASSERAKELRFNNFFHPLFAGSVASEEIDRINMVTSLKAFRPPQTVFEIKAIKIDNLQTATAMNNKRILHTEVIEKFRTREDLEKKKLEISVEAQDHDLDNKSSGKKKFKLISLPSASFKPKNYKDEAFFLNPTKANHDSERGFEIDKNEQPTIEDMVLDLMPDESQSIFRQRSVMHWDQKSKKFIQLKGAAAKNVVRTESGQLVNKTKFEIKKGKMYEEWSSKTKKEIGKIGELEDHSSKRLYDDAKAKGKFKHHQVKKDKVEKEKELKTFHQIRKSKQKRQQQKTREDINKKRKQYKQQSGKGAPPKKKRKF